MATIDLWARVPLLRRAARIHRQASQQDEPNCQLTELLPASSSPEADAPAGAPPLALASVRVVARVQAQGHATKGSSSGTRGVQSSVCSRSISGWRIPRRERGSHAAACAGKHSRTGSAVCARADCPKPNNPGPLPGPRPRRLGPQPPFAQLQKRGMFLSGMFPLSASVHLERLAVAARAQRHHRSSTTSRAGLQCWAAPVAQTWRERVANLAHPSCNVRRPILCSLLARHIGAPGRIRDGPTCHPRFRRLRGLRSLTFARPATFHVVFGEDDDAKPPMSASGWQTRF